MNESKPRRCILCTLSTLYPLSQGFGLLSQPETSSMGPLFSHRKLVTWLGPNCLNPVEYLDIDPHSCGQNTALRIKTHMCLEWCICVQLNC